jgi:hypothetical protein
MDYTDEQIQKVMELLGVDQSDVLRAHSCARTHEALNRQLKRAYRKLALELHPDRTGGDEEKSRLFQLATRMVEEIRMIQPRVSPRRVKWAVRLKAVAVTA